MTRENILFALVGLLLGYVVAFHLVVYVKQRQPLPAGAEGASVEVEAAAEQSATPANDSKDRQHLVSAAQQAAQAAREDPKDFDAQRTAAEAALAARDFEGAIDFLTLANQLRPDDYKTIVRLGHANAAAERFETAERWFRAALARKPDDGDVRSELAITFIMRKPSQPDKAVAELRRGLEQNPRHLTTLHNLSYVLMQVRDYEGASATLDKLERIDPSYEMLPVLREELEKERRKGPPSGKDSGDSGQRKTPA